MLYREGVYEEIQDWLRLADDAVADIRAGRRPRAVPTRVVRQAEMQPWARDIVWDCRVSTACVPVQRSTRHTPFHGRRLSRSAVRRVAQELGWHDSDIIDQIGEGGIETRSDCELETVLAFHHDSLLSQLETAEKGVAAHIAERWTDAPVRHLPFVPCRMQPRGVIEQARARVRDDGTLEEYWKPRITTDGSFGGVDSGNAGIPDTERGTVLPTGQTLGRGWAICGSAFDGQPPEEGGGTSTDGYCIDAESAYSFCIVQEADLWQQCFLWWDADGIAGVAVDRRMGFGGAFAPNRFERVSTFCAAYAQHLQSAFDTAQPPPPCAQRWTADRRALQERGQLPPGEGQLHPRYLQVYLDDFTGCCSTDAVVPPREVAGVTFEHRHMIAAGCNPSPVCSRVYVHAQLTVLALRTLGLVAAPHKIACGTPLPALGLIFDGTSRTIGCPAGKRDAIEALCARTLEETRSTCRVDRPSAARLVGRLCNLSQVAPALQPLLVGGYRVTQAAWHSKGGHSASLKTLLLRRDSPAYDAWVALLERAPGILTDQGTVAMAPRRLFPGRRLAGTLASVTDASGDDGVGGFAWLAGAPRRVFVFSEPWPEAARLALAAAADEDEAELRRQGDASAAPHLSVPAAELFGSILLPTMVRREEMVQRAYSVSDAGAAVHALNSLRSGNGQMASLLQGARALSAALLGVHVLRTSNQDADRLSHPELAASVIAEATAAGFEVTRLRPRASDWAHLQLAIDLSCAGPGRAKRSRSRPASTPD